MTAKYVYFFHGERYVRYNARTDTLEPPFTRKITETWNGWPASFASGVDAAVNWGDGSVYFFKGPHYIRYDILPDRVATGDPPFPRRITDFWNHWPASFASGVDAAVNWGDGRVYFFKGPNYILWDVAADRVPAADPPYPRPILGNWNGWPAEFNRVDAAVNWGNGTSFYFKDGRYLRFDHVGDHVGEVVPPYPLDIDVDQWPALVPVGFTSGISTALEWPYAEIASINVPANRSGCTETFFSVTESFDMNIDFASGPYPAACWCGEYRQFVRGTIFHNGRPVNHAMPDPAGGTRPLLPRPAPGAARDNFQEDGIPGATSTSGVTFFYGHRGTPNGNAEAHDRYLPERTGGCQYRGRDKPSPGQDAFGGPAEIDADFRGQAIDVANGNEVIATREWRVNCRRP